MFITILRSNALDDLLEIAAVYGISICKGHAFLAGNKRTAMVSMGAFLILNNFKLTAPNEEIEQIMVDIAEDRVDHEALTKWLRTNTIDSNKK